jgi:DNA-binding NtrC family response regulator
MSGRNKGPLGSNTEQHTDARLIRATNVNLERAVAEHHFREDLYYRLDVISITVPTLREHREDIPFLLEQFLAKECSSLALTAGARELLCQYDWSGNVRQFEHTLRKLAFEANGATVHAEFVAPRLKLCASHELPPAPPAATAPVPTDLPTWVQSRADLKSFQQQMEQAFYQRLLREHDQNVQAAAQTLHISRAALYKVLQRAKRNTR